MAAVDAWCRQLAVFPALYLPTLKQSHRPAFTRTLSLSLELVQLRPWVNAHLDARTLRTPHLVADPGARPCCPCRPQEGPPAGSA